MINEEELQEINEERKQERYEIQYEMNTEIAHENLYNDLKALIEKKASKGVFKGKKEQLRKLIINILSMEKYLED